MPAPQRAWSPPAPPPPTPATTPIGIQRFLPLARPGDVRRRPAAFTVFNDAPEHRPDLRVRGSPLGKILAALTGRSDIDPDFLLETPQPLCLDADTRNIDAGTEILADGFVDQCLALVEIEVGYDGLAENEQQNHVEAEVQFVPYAEHALSPYCAYRPVRRRRTVPWFSRARVLGRARP